MGKLWIWLISLWCLAEAFCGISESEEDDFAVMGSWIHLSHKVRHSFSTESITEEDKKHSLQTIKAFLTSSSPIQKLTQEDRDTLACILPLSEGFFNDNFSSEELMDFIFMLSLPGTFSQKKAFFKQTFSPYFFLVEAQESRPLGLHMTDSFLRNVFPVRFGSEKQKTFYHGRELSSLGRTLVDMAQGILHARVKRESCESSHALICKDIYKLGMTGKDLKDFQELSATYFIEKHNAFQKGLQKCVKYFCDSDHHWVKAGLYFAFQECGIKGWPEPHTLTQDLNEALNGFFESSLKVFENYYMDCLISSPQDGKTPYIDDLPFSMKKILEQENALLTLEEARFLVKTLEGGLMVEIEGLIEEKNFTYHFPTQKWLFEEAQYFQSILSESLGEKSPYIVKNIPVEKTSSFQQDYIKKTKEGICVALRSLNFYMKEALLGSLKEVARTFSEDIRTAQENFMKKCKSKFAQKPYWDFLETHRKSLKERVLSY